MKLSEAKVHAMWESYTHSVDPTHNGTNPGRRPWDMVSSNTKAALVKQGFFAENESDRYFRTLTFAGLLWIGAEIDAAHAEALDIEWTRNAVVLDLADEDQCAQFGSWVDARAVVFGFMRGRKPTATVLRDLITDDHCQALDYEAELAEFGAEWDAMALASGAVYRMPVYSVPWYADKSVHDHPARLYAAAAGPEGSREYTDAYQYSVDKMDAELGQAVREEREAADGVLIDMGRLDRLMRHRDHGHEVLNNEIMTRCEWRGHL